ncbi:AmmeMemoRadiSam system protein A, partial [Actinomyces sp. MRS3W]|uniref:AmmeMemoRadiSam system protein A n=1 Tax=Actinomyces sp. MRS3W TaxID=2800796 RepID=UPI0028FD8102
RDVVENAIAAALRDPRFPPVTAAELPSLRLEVSVLTAPQPLDAASEQDVLRRLHPGVDGVVLRLGARRATFLPQVWQELPEPEQFLRQLKRKAGWSPGFWDEDLVVETYRVRAWEEP